MQAFLHLLRNVVALPERSYKKFIFEPYSSWHYDEQKRRAMADEEYARIESLRHTNPKTGGPLDTGIRFLDDELTFEHWEYQRALEEKLLPRGMVYELHWWLNAHGPTKVFDTIVQFCQRGLRGWADSDVWNLHNWLSTVIATSLREMAKTSHGWPGDHSTWPTFEDWTTALNDMADRMEKLSSDWIDTLDRDEQQTFIEETFTKFGEMYLHLWD